VDDPRPWYAAANVVAVPSRWEGLALVPLEAMASARCVVASTVCGVRGSAVPVGDVRTLAAAIIGRLRRPDLADAQAVVASTEVCREHDVTKATARMRSAYRLTMAAPLRARVLRARPSRVGLGAAR
jgi:glycosyltransferase involved in cell wall biosynthesis